MNAQEQALNERVAREVMGWVYVAERQWWEKEQSIPGALPPMYIKDFLPDYQGDIGAAWSVVEKLLQYHGMRFAIQADTGLNFDTSIHMDWRAGFHSVIELHSTVITAPTAPLAICHAALDILAKLPPRA
jgi:hypothetical protein